MSDGQQPEGRRDLSVPKEDWRDVLRTVLEGTVGAVPVVGSLGAAVFSLLVPSAYQKRTQDWQQEVSDTINRQHEKGAVDVEKVRDDPTFVDTVIQATRIAATTSNRAKLDALRAAVANAAARESPDETRRHMFLRMVDDFTGWHLRFLALYDDPHRWFTENGFEPRRAGTTGTTEIAGVLNEAFPEMHSEGELRERIWKDLFAAGLVGTESLRSVSSEAGRYASRTTQLGKDFMRFIRLPPE